MSFIILPNIHHRHELPRNWSLDLLDNSDNIDILFDDTDFPFHQSKRAIKRKSDLLGVVNKINKLFKPNENECTDDKFKVTLNMEDDYKPENLKVKVEGNQITVEGKYEENFENGYTRKEFSKYFTLPENIILEELKSKLTIDGTLTIEAPLKQVTNSEKKEYIIPITFEKSKKEISSTLMLKKTSEKKKLDENDNENDESQLSTTTKITKDDPDYFMFVEGIDG